MRQLLPRLRQAVTSAPPQLLAAGVVCVAALATALYPALSGRVQRFREPAAATAPADDAPLFSEDGPALSQPVEEAFEAAKQGDLDAYLSQFAEPLRGELDRTRREKGDAYLREYLARSTGTVKGLAVDLTRKEETGPEQVRLPVEFVYADRNETQAYVLRKSDGQWRISRIDTVRSTPTLIPYGTPIDQVR